MRSLESAAGTIEDALGVLERGLSETRSAWNDAVRQGFDRQNVAPILAEGKRAATELQQLARDLRAAITLLESSG